VVGVHTSCCARPLLTPTPAAPRCTLLTGRCTWHRGKNGGKAIHRQRSKTTSLKFVTSSQPKPHSFDLKGKGTVIIPTLDRKLTGKTTAADKKSAIASMSNLMHAVLSDTPPRIGTGNELSRQRLSASGGVFDKHGLGSVQPAAAFPRSTGGTRRAQGMVAMSTSGSKTASDASKPRNNSAVATTSRDDPGFDETRCESEAFTSSSLVFCSIQWRARGVEGLSTLNSGRLFGTCPIYPQHLLGTTRMTCGIKRSSFIIGPPIFLILSWDLHIYPHHARQLRRIAPCCCAPNPLAAARPLPRAVRPRNPNQN